MKAFPPGSNVHFNTSKTLVIVGAGEAGVAAAAAIREKDALCRILLLSEEAELPYARPPLSKEMIVEGCAATLIRPKEWFHEAGIELLLHTRVHSINPKQREVLFFHGVTGQRQTVRYDAILLATGARVRKITGDHQVVYLRTSQDSVRLSRQLNTARSVAIIGGGIIGLEVASSARTLGKDVTVIDLTDRLMARALPPEISQIVLERHTNAGVKVILNAGSISVDGNMLTLGNGLKLEADLIVAGIGVTPNDDLARNAGCAVDNGILIDGCGRTSVAGIFAAGDVAHFHHPLFERYIRVEAWKHAGRQGAHVGRAMIGLDDEYRDAPWFWTDQHGLNLQVVGDTTDISKTVWRELPGKRTAFHFKGDRLVAVTALDNGREIRPATRLIEARWQGDPNDLLDATETLSSIEKRLLSSSPVGCLG